VWQERHPAESYPASKVVFNPVVPDVNPIWPWLRGNL
jgi:hypothetical protein